ncbi:MAG: hypothetical protein AAGB01_04470 [Cyanobacteria bacterium P01_F01_bin.42]
MRKSVQLVLLLPLLVLVLGYLVFGSPENGLFRSTYRPSSPEIEALAVATTMTPDAQQLFYRQKPQVASKENFHSLCNKVERNREKTVLLGCFTSNGYRGNIVIQSITDSRLEGTMEVVAAHELLHAAYQKLSRKERKALAPKLEQAAERVDDSFLSPVIEAYQQGDRQTYRNELHSYLGTELANLGDPSLEAYYQKYFSDRQAIIAFSKRSRQELRKIEAQAEKLADEIDGLEARLKSEESSLQSLANDLDYRAQNLEQMRLELLSLQRQAESALLRGQRGVVDQFKRAQERFNSEVRFYNRQVESQQERVARFNQDFERYRQKIQTYNQLNQDKNEIIAPLKLDSAGANAKPVVQNKD